MNYTYIIKCADSTLYTGWTNDLDKRIKAHNSGKGAKYTKTRRPVKLVYYEEHETKNEAMSREYAIKQLTRREKELLIQGNGNLCEKECGIKSKGRIIDLFTFINSIFNNSIIDI